MNITFDLPVNVGRFPKGTLTVEGIYHKLTGSAVNDIYYTSAGVKVDIYPMLKQYAPEFIERMEELAHEHAEAMNEESDFSHANNEE